MLAICFQLCLKSHLSLFHHNEHFIPLRKEILKNLMSSHCKVCGRGQREKHNWAYSVGCITRKQTRKLEIGAIFVSCVSILHLWHQLKPLAVRKTWNHSISPTSEKRTATQRCSYRTRGWAGSGCSWVFRRACWRVCTAPAHSTAGPPAAPGWTLKTLSLYRRAAEWKDFALTQRRIHQLNSSLWFLYDMK